MPGLHKLSSARPDPFAYANIQAIEKIMSSLGRFETIRQRRDFNKGAVQIISSGGEDMPQRMAHYISGYQTQYSPGVRGMFQKIGAAYAPTEPTQGITEQMMSTTLGTALDPMYQARLGLVGAQTEATQVLTQERLRPQQSEIQKLISEGYTPTDARQIRDVFHGLAPRAGTYKELEQKPLPDQLSFWQTVYNKTLDPEWGGIRPTEDMDAVRDVAKQKIDRVTDDLRTQLKQPSFGAGLKQTELGFGVGLGPGMLPAKTRALPSVSQQQLVIKLSKMKIEGKPIGPNRGRQIVKDYPAISEYLPNLTPAEQAEVLGAIADGMTEAEILRFFRQ